MVVFAVDALPESLKRVVSVLFIVMFVLTDAFPLMLEPFEEIFADAETVTEA